MEHNTIQTADELVMMYANGNNAAFGSVFKEGSQLRPYTCIEAASVKGQTAKG